MRDEERVRVGIKPLGTGDRGLRVTEISQLIR